MIKLNEEESIGEFSTTISGSEEKHQQHDSSTNQVDMVETLPPVSLSESSDDVNTTKGREKEKNDVIRFTMLFNKVNSDFELKRNSRNNEDVDGKHKKDVKAVMFFNSDVTIRSNADSDLNTPTKTSSENSDGDSESNSSAKSKISTPKPVEVESGKPQISEPEMMFSNSLTFSTPEVFQARKSKQSKSRESLKKFFYKRNSKMENGTLVQANAHPSMRTDLRSHNSLTTLPKNNKFGLKGSLTSKMPSLTAIETDFASQKTRIPRYSHRDGWNDLVLMETDVDKRLNLQISKSSNDNNRRMALRSKKDEAASVSDSKLLNGDFESKKQIKKCDKKSRGDSRKKDGESGGRKQVQWKTEVDVIYFSTHLAANGDRTGEVIGRVMEPLREEWEQQRKGFYAKMVPYHIESHIKDRFISLLKI